MEDAPSSPKGPGPDRRADGDPFRAARPSSGGSALALPGEPEEAPDRRARRARVPPSPLPVRRPPVGDGSGGGVLTIPRRHARAATQKVQRARARATGGDRDLPDPSALPQDRRQVLQRAGSEGGLLPPRANAGPPPGGIGAFPAARAGKARRALPGGDQPERAQFPGYRRSAG